MAVIATILRQSSGIPSALAKTPTVTGWYQADGNVRPIIFAPPDSDETGANSPEKFTAGTIDKIAVAKTAATCVRVNDEINCPKPVVATTYTIVAISKVRNGPLSDTPNTKIAIRNRKTKFTIATPM